MRFNVPKRFSPEWWFWIKTATFVFAVITGILLFFLNLELNINFLIIVLVVSVLGDIALALSFEAVAPSDITVGPGERRRNDSELKETATILSGFKDSNLGVVSTRGERWAAKYILEEQHSLTAGDVVEILGRNGLTLLIGACKDNPT